MSSAVACSTRLEGTPVQGEDATVTQPQCLSNFIQVDERAEMISVHSWVHKEAWALGPPLDVTLLAYEEHAGHAQPPGEAATSLQQPQSEPGSLL